MRTKIFCFVLLLVGWIGLSHSQGEISDPVAALDLVVQDLLKGGLSGKRVLVHPERLPPGTSVQTCTSTALVIPSAGYVVFIDDMAFAGFEHPCRYVFVDEKTGSFLVKNRTTPPLDQEHWLEMETEAYSMLMQAENRRACRSAVKAPPGKSAKGGELYAVLLNGGLSSSQNHVRFWNDLSNIYITLKDRYGYKDDHIYVLCSDGLNPYPDQSNGQSSDPDLDGDGDYDIQGACTFANVKDVFTTLQAVLTPQDQLFLFVTDHGGTYGPWKSHIFLWSNATMKDHELELMLEPLAQCDLISTLEPCNSGGFQDNLSLTYGRVFSAACEHDKPSYGLLPDLLYCAYAFYWTAAVKGEDAYGNPVDADLNADGKISMHEAFLYAEENDPMPEIPQYNDTPEGHGDVLSLSASGSIHYVPTDFASIQQAIDQAETGAVIRVEPGTFQEQISFLGKEIVVESTGGPQRTLLDGGGSGGVVVFESGETEKSVLRGFTIINGAPGIFCKDASPSLYDNIIASNGDENHPTGGGIGCVSASPILINCVIHDNQAIRGGGLHLKDASCRLLNCTVACNRAMAEGGGFFCTPSSDPRVTNCILWENLPDQVSSPSSILMTYSNVQGGYGGEGNIDEEPLWELPNWGLLRNSPCINMGDNEAVSAKGLDLFGQCRVNHGLVDMGACEGGDCILTADTLKVNPLSPKSVLFHFDFGASCAFRPYIMAGSAIGGAPGMKINNTLVPLVWDPYFALVLQNLNSKIFMHFEGILDASGKGTAFLFWLGGSMPSLLGVTLYHGVFTWDPIDAASNPLPLFLTDS